MTHYDNESSRGKSAQKSTSVSPVKEEVYVANRGPNNSRGKNGNELGPLLAIVMNVWIINETRSYTQTTKKG